MVEKVNGNAKANIESLMKEYKSGKVEIDGKTYDVASEDLQKLLSGDEKIKGKVKFDFDGDGIFDKQIKARRLRNDDGEAFNKDLKDTKMNSTLVNKLIDADKKKADSTTFEEGKKEEDEALNQLRKNGAKASEVGKTVWAKEHPQVQAKKPEVPALLLKAAPVNTPSNPVVKKLESPVTKAEEATEHVHKHHAATHKVAGHDVKRTTKSDAKKLKGKKALGKTYTVEYKQEDGSAVRETKTKNGSINEIGMLNATRHYYTNKEFVLKKLASAGVKLKNTLASKSKGIYYMESNKTHYQWDNGKHKFVAMDGVSMVDTSGRQYNAKGQYTDEAGTKFTLKKGGKVVERGNDYTSVHHYKPNGEDSEVEIDTNGEKFRTDYDEKGNRIKRTLIKKDSNAFTYYNPSNGNITQSITDFKSDKYDRTKQVHSNFIYHDDGSSVHTTKDTYKNNKTNLYYWYLKNDYDDGYEISEGEYKKYKANSNYVPQKIK